VSLVYLVEQVSQQVVHCELSGLDVNRGFVANVIDDELLNTCTVGDFLDSSLDQVSALELAGSAARIDNDAERYLDGIQEVIVQVCCLLHISGGLSLHRFDEDSLVLSTLHRERTVSLEIVDVTIKLVLSSTLGTGVSEALGQELAITLHAEDDLLPNVVELQRFALVEDGEEACVVDEPTIGRAGCWCCDRSGSCVHVMVIELVTKECL
jgi:hypothetical protein